MNRVTRGSVMLAALLSALSCSGDPTSALRNGVDHLLASPSALFITPGTPKAVLVMAVDAQGNQLGTTFALGTVGAGITVVRNDSFNLVYNNAGQLVMPSTQISAQYRVSTTNNTATTSFTVSAGGKSITIPVRVNPDTAASLTLSATAPTLGDTVTVTVPANYKFTPASVVSVPGILGIKQLSLSADSTQIQFLPGPSANGPVSVSHVILVYAPSISYTATSGVAKLTTTVVTSLPVTFSNVTPSIPQAVTMTAGTGFQFLPSAGDSISIAGGTLLLLGQSADSTSITFVPVPGGTSGPVTVKGVVLSSLTAVPLTLATAPDLTVPASYPATAFATAPTFTIPATGDSITYFDAGPEAAVSQCVNDLGGDCRVYKFVLSGSRTFHLKATWQGSTDLGVYFYDSTPALIGSIGAACDQNGEGATGQPEQCTVTLAAGTYYFVADDFGPFYPDSPAPPQYFRYDITGM